VPFPRDMSLCSRYLPSILLAQVKEDGHRLVVHGTGFTLHPHLAIFFLLVRPYLHAFSGAATTPQASSLTLLFL